MLQLFTSFYLFVSVHENASLSSSKKAENTSLLYIHKDFKYSGNLRSVAPEHFGELSRNRGQKDHSAGRSEPKDTFLEFTGIQTTPIKQTYSKKLF